MKDFCIKEDLMKILDISENMAYKIIRALNAELKEQGYKTICDRLHRKYFDKRYRINQFMSVYKDKIRNSWYVEIRYKTYNNEHKKRKKEALI